MAERGGTQNEPVMDGATDADADEKWRGLVEQSEADHPHSDGDAQADAEARRHDLEHDEGSNQPDEHRPGSDAATQ